MIVSSADKNDNRVDPKGVQQSLFLRACRREPVETTPIWIMRQAGRYMPEYRAIRDKVSFIELCKNPQLASEVTLMAVEKLGVDAAILFSDILLIVESFGMDLRYAEGDGPIIKGKMWTSDGTLSLPKIDVKDSLSYVMDAVRLIRKDLPAGIPLIGFSGAPFTLASYMLEGGASRNFLATKKFMYTRPKEWKVLMMHLTEALEDYLLAQIEAGADCLQIFDSWVGCLGEDDYRQFVLPYSKKLIASIQGKVPVIHFGTGTGVFFEAFAAAGGDVLGVDFRLGLNRAHERIGNHFAYQGNLDPVVLFAGRAEIEKRAKKVLMDASCLPGHIFNLGHGVLPQTPVENVKALVDFVHSVKIEHRT